MTTQQTDGSSITTNDLAGWLDDQGHERWWTVDGDPLLMGRLDFPCPGDELAEELRSRNGRLVIIKRPGSAEEEKTLVHDEHSAASKGRAGATVDIGHFVECLGRDKALYLRWEDEPAESVWMLIEDSETTESVRSEITVGAGARFDAPRVLLPTVEDVRYVKRFLDETAESINGRVGDRLAALLTSFHQKSPDLIDAKSTADRLAKDFQLALVVDGIAGSTSDGM